MTDAHSIPADGAEASFDRAAHETMLDALDRGDREGAQRALNRLNRVDTAGQPLPPDGYGKGGDESVATAQAAVGHLAGLDPGFVDIVRLPELGNDEGMIAVAEDFGARLDSRLGDEWDTNAQPPGVPAEVAREAAETIAASPEASRLFSELGAPGSTAFSESLGYVYAATSHIAERHPDLLAKLMAADPDNPADVIANRPAIIAAAAQYGRLLVHGKRGGRSSSTKGQSRMITESTAPATALPGEDVDDLIAEKLSALASNDRIKAHKLEARINAHFARYAGNPVVGRGGRHV